MFFILSMEETLRTSQEGFIPTGFVKLIMLGVLKKKRMALSFVCAKIFIKCHIFFGIFGISKLCFTFFSKCRFDNVFARKRDHSTI